MLCRLNALEAIRREGLQKGAGGGWCTYAIAPGAARAGSHLKMVGRIALDPGAAVGEHLHDVDEEVYVILSGGGVYFDGDTEYEVGPGDVTVTFRGERHGLRNTGTEPLVFLAFIAG
jgi:mannose-6-phosphate isomerase-like protein (cupin superfamily)